MLGLLQLIPLVWRLAALGAALVSIAGFAAYEHHKLVVEGEQVELKRIEDANAAERAKAQAGSQDVDACFAAGRVWDRAAGMCGDAPR